MKNTTFTLVEFKREFAKQHGYISHSLSDKELVDWIEDHSTSCKVPLPLSAAIDWFQDYLLSQGLADVQE